MTAFTDKAVLAGGWIKANWRWVRWLVAGCAGAALVLLARCM